MDELSRNLYILDINNILNGKLFKKVLEGNS